MYQGVALKLLHFQGVHLEIGNKIVFTLFTMVWFSQALTDSQLFPASPYTAAESLHTAAKLTEIHSVHLCVSVIQQALARYLHPYACNLPMHLILYLGI